MPRDVPSIPIDYLKEKAHEKTLIAIAAAASALTAGTAFAQSFDGTSPWQCACALHLDSENGGAAGDAGVSINNKWIPEVDVSYFFTPNIAAELVLTYPQSTACI